MDAVATSLPADADSESYAEAVGRAEHDKARIALTRDGRPVAFIVPVEDAAALEALEDAQDAAAVREGLAEYERAGAAWPRYTPEELAARWAADPGA